jgi:glycosyltransferase involved in cell wall biosynthesis
MRILHLTTQGEPCGIADYDGRLRHHLIDAGHASEFHRIPQSEFDFSTRAEIVAFFDKFVEKARSYDAIVIEHEYGFFSGPFSLKFGLDNLSRVIEKLAGRKIILISHTDPSLVNLDERKTVADYFSTKRLSMRRLAKTINKHGVKLVVHGSVARRAWINVGINRRQIENLYIPLELPANAANDQAPYDGKRIVWLAVFGFIGEYKGYQAALEALHYLPENYRLMIIGGVHPRARNEMALEKIMRFRATGLWPNGSMKSRPSQLSNKGFEDRVVVTGYLGADEVLRCMGETDLILAPYLEGGPSGSAAVGVGLKSGKPVIASKTRSFEEIQFHSGALKMVSSGAPAELALVIEKLMANQDERTELVGKIYAYGQTRTWADYIARLGLDK